MKKVLIFLVLLVGCGPPKDHLTDYQKTGTYPVSGECKEPVAAVVIERNGRFDVAASMGSASLVGHRSKDLGIFTTADHMIELDIEYKLFFCGKVYKAQRIIDAGVTDIGFLRIVDDFNPADFPEPYPVGDMPKVGEDVFARGIHMHRESLQKDKVIHRITEMYYGIKETETVNGKLETKEFVYDNLPAKVLSEDALIAFMERPDINAESLEYMTKNHPTLMKTRDDHKISFGGLSGGPTVNARGEVVGVNVVEFGNEGDYIWDENGITYRPRVTLAILTSDNIKRALNGLNMDSR
ncbi:MAG: hypothetical protein A2655_01110 [Candidatus Yanofskybacteria bacterium RIFCSPHIGHO2_01_FULL_43_42]|uniref:Serine protease n=1 Tax=Candidatus Yanofskybacteria bacterium RIFCSPLOWO2_01_FULL_43_22 TaxID=1802695 RepID=A0A1F8GER9_9BACT|nr:MAG: hypothetical protein A2655_01110 [Candidatus Yanofskybacteria bacterium RIFCSPHIGHO2_01_FULL_43_42]OGN12409.1 MAG: hypothetical protein A3D48_01840 [Candidatus Yanofskybacteria bacterium RIFCSPHIGHO2_02_FULL_43_17]OGN23781.1 MAG: hypothetical protein A3A13_01900 [Candidatus Yanofskybacteria bacterium RIFCSPLOWO2_01_FULL_43_22]